MSESSEKRFDAEWRPGLIVDWLIDEGRFAADMNDLIRRLGEKMLASGAPVWRLRLSMRTLHPLVTAVSSVWERDVGSAKEMVSTHGLELRSGYVGSPIEMISRSQAPYRKRLKDALTAADHTVLHELKRRGGTDYFGLPARFADGASAIMMFVTDAADGFSDRDIAGFTRVASVVALIAEAHKARRISVAVAEAYLGPRTGRRVLEGKITRGDIESIDAAVLVSDIRDWAGINNRLAADEALALANSYFEIVAEAVESHDGEILKFIGDGVLAVFPTDHRATDGRAACERALAAARHALRHAGEADPPLGLRFGIGLHFGEVLYGNVGSRTRIDFTVLGKAVNVAARIEGLCARLGRPVLLSAAVADRLSAPAERIARETLKGDDDGSDIFTVDALSKASD